MFFFFASILALPILLCFGRGFTLCCRRRKLSLQAASQTVFPACSRASALNLICTSSRFAHRAALGAKKHVVQYPEPSACRHRTYLGRLVLDTAFQKIWQLAEPIIVSTFDETSSIVLTFGPAIGNRAPVPRLREQRQRSNVGRPMLLQSMESFSHTAPSIPTPRLRRARYHAVKSISNLIMMLLSTSFMQHSSTCP